MATVDPGRSTPYSFTKKEAWKPGTPMSRPLASEHGMPGSRVGE